MSSALEIFGNALYKCSFYLLTYLLALSSLEEYSSCTNLLLGVPNATKQEVKEKLR